jgi:hypothetical protein
MLLSVRVLRFFNSQNSTAVSRQKITPIDIFLPQKLKIKILNLFLIFIRPCHTKDFSLVKNHKTNQILI